MPYVHTSARGEIGEFYPPLLAPRSLSRLVNRGMGVSVGGTISTGIEAAAPFTGPAAPFVAAAGLIAGFMSQFFQGCGQTCVVASNDANQIGNAMTANLNAYMAQPIHYKSIQTAALQNYDTLWAQLQQACQNPQLGSAGKNCISDRQQGACKWKASPGGWSQVNGKWTYQGYGPAGSGSACWNYFIGMRDPIANDPTVVPDPSPLTAPAGNTTAASSSAGLPALSSSWLIPAGLAGLGLLLYFGSQN